MAVNGKQEKERVRKMRMKAEDLKKIQDKKDKDAIWEPIPNAPGNAKRIKKL